MKSMHGYGMYKAPTVYSNMEHYAYHRIVHISPVACALWKLAASTLRLMKVSQAVKEGLDTEDVSDGAWSRTGRAGSRIR